MWQLVNTMALQVKDTVLTKIKWSHNLVRWQRFDQQDPSACLTTSLGAKIEVFGTRKLLQSQDWFSNFILAKWFACQQEGAGIMLHTPSHFWPRHSLHSTLNVHWRVMSAVDLYKNRATESSVAIMCLDAVETTAHMPSVPYIVPDGEFHLIVIVPPL